jgi:anti-sigma regulatory factor (Ser/Thr protein kinase)
MNNQQQSKQVLTLQNTISDAGKLAEFLADYVKKFEIADEIYNDLRLVAEETFVNIASYAYTGQAQQTVTIELNSTADKISITFTDTGIAFNPLTDAAECKESNDHCEGGMGIHLITSLSDHQEYSRDGQSNVFMLTKHYTSEEQS